MGIKQDMRAFFLDAPEEALQAMDLPQLDHASELTGLFDYIHFFAKDATQFKHGFPKLKNHLKGTGALWVSWPKSGQLQTDLTLISVIKLGYDFGLVESKCLSINATWSALKFTHPKEGKVYANSYGKLKG